MAITTALMVVPVSMKPASVLRDLEESTACTVSFLCIQNYAMTSLYIIQKSFDALAFASLYRCNRV